VVTEGDANGSLAGHLAELAARGEIALRLDTGSLDRMLRAIVEATVGLFDAEAASIALVEPDGRLRFRVAAGDRALGVVGLTVAQGEGIAGYVAATGQPIAVSDVADDPRFDRSAAERTGYVPRSILAVPLVGGDRTVGVLEVLDRRGAVGFGLADIALAGTFARIAGEAIEVSRVERDVQRLVVRAIVAATGERGDELAPAAEGLTAAATAELERSPAFWALVDRLAAIRGADPERLSLVGDLVAAAVPHLSGGDDGSSGTTRGPRGARDSWRDLAADDE
jgi:GAF domain-containing protein